MVKDKATIEELAAETAEVRSDLDRLMDKMKAGKRLWSAEVRDLESRVSILEQKYAELESH